MKKNKYNQTKLSNRKFCRLKLTQFCGHGKYVAIWPPTRHSLFPYVNLMSTSKIS